MIHFTVQDDQWTVTCFISEHNHELATPSKRHLLMSARPVSVAKANVINSMVSVGIHPTDVYSYMSNEVGGTKNVGFTKRDCYNYINKQKMMMIEAGDGQSLLIHFKVKASDMEVEKELTKLCVSKNNELKENETNARVVIRSSQIIEELSSNDDHVVKEGDSKTSPILDPPCAKSKRISISRLKGHLEKRKSRASQLHKPDKALDCLL
ncbi:hypothetical protein GOBAR_DD23692 [Gossypium barbadense]|nr:hypothetical protein GOBAR_DD23692 [Gossypium barbadense]